MLSIAMGSSTSTSRGPQRGRTTASVRGRACLWRLVGLVWLTGSVSGRLAGAQVGSPPGDERVPQLAAPRLPQSAGIGVPAGFDLEPRSLGPGPRVAHGAVAGAEPPRIGLGERASILSVPRAPERPGFRSDLRTIGNAALFGGAAGILVGAATIRPRLIGAFIGMPTGAMLGAGVGLLLLVVRR